MGWRTYDVSEWATDAENVDRAMKGGLSILTMDGDYKHFPLLHLPFTVVLGSLAQQSTSSATAQIQHLHQLIRLGEITPTIHQRVTMTAEDARVEVWARDVTSSRRISAKRVRKPKRR
jgi:hypothetical protein